MFFIWECFSERYKLLKTNQVTTSQEENWVSFFCLPKDHFNNFFIYMAE